MGSLSDYVRMVAANAVDSDAFFEVRVLLMGRFSFDVGELG